MLTLRIPKLREKKFIYFLLCIRMSRKNVNFGDKKIKKVTFTKTKK